jgi:DNA-binding MarR family transcriptional regulator
VPSRRSDPKAKVDSPLRAIKADEITWVLRDVFRGYVDTNVVFGHKLDLSVNDMTAIEHLLENTELGPVELGHRLGIRSASATAMVDRLEEAGHVQRRPHPTDRRRRTLEVTESATRSLMETVGPLVSDLSKIAEALSPEQRVVVSEYLTAVVSALRMHGEFEGPAV